jgi:tRNA dimethylallyltransferase
MKRLFAVSDYEKMALPIVERLLESGKTPIICGGTGFYINALLYKRQFGNVGANQEIREKYE